ncbi:MAG: type II toxin-antitoxin system VapC family toxin [Rhabdochlamydiaceae bacterium]
MDTNILIEVIGNNLALQEKLEQMGEKAATTAVTKYELLKAPREETALAFLNTLEIYEYDSIAAARAARIFKELKRRGRLINELDILIASIAMARGELLVTMDNDFKSVENLQVMII